ncbi:hypothetical protein [Seleniivibrio sp.]|uniref:hypothetical protein n=1 Tax=Seleniivibrio sp. TaxID=2898801 RepID=UPI0025DAFDA7|nr:hypothetical protein [Seleniivibrio sp.]MCD8554303.1 hypothetical protein [Seleniivibrio sp.]
MGNTFNIEEHLRTYTAGFSQPQVPHGAFRSFIDTELKYCGHLNKNYIQQYGRIFHLLRDKIILPNHNKFNLLPVFEELANLMRRSGIVLPPTENGQRITNAFKNSYGDNDTYWKLNILRMDMVVRSFMNCSDKAEFLKKMSLLKSAECFRNKDELRFFAQNLKMLFPSAEEFMNNYAAVFTSEYAERDITAFKAGIIWLVEISWGIAYKEHPAHMTLMEPLIGVLKEVIKKQYDEAVFYLHFPLSHIYLNLCHTQAEFKTFNEKVEKPISAYMSENMNRWNVKPVQRENSNKRIGFVFDRLVGSSPVKLLISLLNYMKDEKYELYVYDMGYVEKAPSQKEYIDEVLAVGTKYTNGHELANSGTDRYYSHFEKCSALRDAVVRDEIDTLIVTGNRTQSSFLLASRTAPLQLYWDHGNHEYDVNGIDKRICHFNDRYENDFEFSRFTLPMLPKYLAPEEDIKKTEAAEIKKKLPQHRVVLGSIGRIMKLSDEYLETIAEVLKQNPYAIYLACGDGPIAEKRVKVRELGIEDRFIFTGWVDPHIYGHVIDIYLNTFPLTGGESVNEFLSKNGENILVTKTVVPLNPDQEKIRYVCDASEAIHIKTAADVSDNNTEKETSLITIGAAGDIGRFAEEYIKSVAEIISSCPSARFVLFSNSPESLCKERFCSIDSNRFIYINSLDMKVFCRITDICYIPDYGMLPKFLDQVMASEDVYAVFSLNYSPYTSETAALISLNDWERNLGGNKAYLKSLKYSYELYSPSGDVLENLFAFLESDAYGSREKAEKMWSVFRNVIYKDKLIKLGFSEKEYADFDKEFGELPISAYMRRLMIRLVKNKSFRSFMGTTQSKVHNNNLAIRPAAAGLIDIICGTAK